MLQMLTSVVIRETFADFADIMKKHFQENYPKNIKRLRELAECYPKKELIQTNVYQMNIQLNYKKLLANFETTTTF